MGALGEQIGKSPRTLRQLRASLNPFSRFDFGILRCATNARPWQAKEKKGQMRLFEHPDFEQAILQAAEHFRDRGLRRQLSRRTTTLQRYCESLRPRVATK